MKLKDYQNIYMVGIKGVGMAMLAQFLKSKGFTISGSDIKDVFPTDKTLINSQIKFKNGFSLKDFPKKIDLIIYSSAYNDKENIELKYFSNKNIPTISYAQALGYLFDDYFGISVCGSHGKTTVTSWLGYVLQKSGLSPNVLTGSYVRQFKGSALFGKSKYFIAESDEYQNKFQYFNPQAIVLNNIDFDHPDYFKDEKAYFQVFAEFIKKIPASGFVVVNLENALAVRASKNSSAKIIGYYIDDFGNKNNFRDIASKVYLARNLKFKSGYQIFEVFENNRSLGEFKIKLFGRHNVSNALAVISTSLKLGVKLEDLKKALYSFLGSARRFEVLGKYRGNIIIDDYAHHPVEVKACLQAVKQKYKNKKIITVFHPHTITRTKALINDFAESFTQSDRVYLLEIYTSAREKAGGLSSLDLMAKIGQYNMKNKIDQDLKYFKDMKAVERELRKIKGSNNIILLLGAGDVFRVGEGLLKK
ncbi:MAG: UDP-N-acetylmuramate--L-alanine ligase [Patescibacteria group bacterium]|nr:UDP-N-acetylmuramate--L-alanine ligase [Patescibacteria group bacterium]